MDILEILKIVVLVATSLGVIASLIVSIIVESLDRKIESINSDFEKERDRIESQTIPIDFINLQTKKAKEEKDRKINPIERRIKRLTRIFSFIKK
jgi:formyltetrahydrofolate hydrolase